MYKKLFLATLAGALLTACSNDELNENGNNNNDPIAFDTYISKQTRASQTTSKNLNEFGVYAYVTDTDPYQLMDNEKISKTGNNWTYSNIKFWPENHKVDFLAYAPYKADWANYNSGEKAFTYTVSALASAQEDLIAATAFQKDKNSSTNKVNLTFKHLLSRIGFSAQSDNDYGSTQVAITGFKLQYKADAIDSESKFTFATSGDSDANEAGAWEATVTAQFSEGEESGELITENVVLTDNAQTLNTPAESSNTYLMMLPQSVEAGDIQAEITYTITYTNPTAVVTNVKTIDLPAVNWVMGKAYTYNFIIGLSEIEFGDITVSDWSDGDTQPAPSPVS